MTAKIVAFLVNFGISFFDSLYCYNDRVRGTRCFDFVENYPFEEKVV